MEDESEDGGGPLRAAHRPSVEDALGGRPANLLERRIDRPPGERDELRGALARRAGLDRERAPLSLAEWLVPGVGHEAVERTGQVPEVESGGGGAPRRAPE